jgi:hypothetical protein
MPTAFDRLIPNSDHDPLANLLDFGEIDHTVEQAGSLIRDYIVGLINGVVDVIKELTGLDLSALAGVLEGIDLSSPEAFLASLMGAVAQLPAVLTQLVTDIIQMLITLPDQIQTLVDPFIQMLITLPETLFTLVENVVTMLVGSPDTLQNLLTSLVGMLVTLPETLATLLINLVEQLTSPSGTNTLTSLMTSLIDMLVNAPETLQTLLEGLITLLISLPAILVNLGTALMSSSLGMLGSGSLLNSSNLFGLIPGGLIPGLDASSIVSGSFAAPFLQPLIDAISGGMGGTTGLDFASLQSMLDAIPGAGPIIDTFVNNFLNQGGSGFGLDDLARSLQSIPATLLTGSLPAGMLGNLNIGALSSFIPEFLTNPNFDSPNSILGQGLWTWDGTQGPGGLFTSVFTTAAGVLRELLSNLIAVAPGQSLSISGNAQWSGFTGAANSIMLTVAKFDPVGLLMGYDTIASVASPGTASGGWNLLSHNYTVPTGVAGIQARPVVTPGATAGKVWFGKLSVKQTATTLFGGLVPLLDASKIGSGTFPLDMTGVQPLMDTIFQTLTGSGVTGTGFPDIASVLELIPFGNVMGIGGPADLGGSIQSTWDQLISGLVGSVGTGAGLSDLFNIGNQVSSKASRGAAGWDILGIRNNKSLKTGFLPSSQSNISLDKLALAASMPTVPVTQSTALTNYERIGEAIDIGAVSWQGAGTTNVTACFVNLYKMDQTSGVNNLVHQSANIVGSLSATMAPVVYSLPSSVHFDPAEILGVEVTIRGTGTHNMAGSVSALPDQIVYPRRWSSVRDAGTTGPPSSFTPTYGNNVGFVEYAVTAGTLTVPHSPTPMQFNTVGTFTQVVPDWANYVDRIAVGSGGGGGGGTGVGPGYGGGAGNWSTGTWTRGTDFTGTPSVTVVIPAGGANGGSGFSSPGASTTITLSGSTATAAGGLAGDTRAAGATGASPGNQTYLGQTYVGGGTQGARDGVGATPGGGGGGGSAIGPGGNGGPGGAWLVFRQT